MTIRLLNVGANAKTVKGDVLGEYLTGILYLAPSLTSGYQTCPSATEGCKASCLFSAGRGRMHSVESARIRKTKELFENTEEFEKTLIKDITSLVDKAKRGGVKPALRLNGTSDIYWPAKLPKIFDLFPDLIHYNYTKEKKVMSNYMAGKCPPNYYLTFSRSETNWDYCKDVLDAGHTVCAVFKTRPSEYEGYKVFSADETDLRFTDPPGQIGGLTAKGKAKKDLTGFLVQ